MTATIQIEMIAAMTKGLQVIGSHGTIPWMLASDMVHFRDTTRGQIVVMGKRTWLSLPKRPLPNRLNIVITHHPEDIPEIAVSASSVIDAISIAQLAIIDDPEPKRKLMVIGGSEIYQAFMRHATVMHLTHINATVSGDTYFPTVDWDMWRKTDERGFEATPGTPKLDQYSFEICRYERV